MPVAIRFFLQRAPDTAGGLVPEPFELIVNVPVALPASAATTQLAATPP